MPPLLRSFVAILAGYMVMIVVSVALTLIFLKTMGKPSGHLAPGYLVFNAIYTLLAAAIGGFTTASIARLKPLQHAGILAAVMCLMGIVSYRHYTGQQPVWYQWMLTILPSLAALAGAALYARNAPRLNS